MVAQDTVDLPPQHSFLAFDAAGVSQRCGDRVVLAWESADEQVGVGYLVNVNGGDVSVRVSGGPEPAAINYGGVLPFRRGLPLVVPYCFVVFGGSFESDAEAAYSGEKLDDAEVIARLSK